MSFSDDAPAYTLKNVIEKLDFSDLMGYKKCFRIMGKDRNSYFKTDLKATFMTKGQDPADERGAYAEWAVKAGIP